MAAMPTTDSAPRRFAVACGVLSQYVRGAGGAPSSFLAPVGAAVPAPLPAAEPQQLTIFYGGRVVVLDACPPEKAAELIRLAAAAQATPASADPAPALVDMPIARKASLRRFLAKRKDRSSSSTTCDDRQANDDQPEPPPPAAKKGKTTVEASGEEASSSSSWLALGLGLGLGGPMHGR